MKKISMNKSILLAVVLTACLCVPMFAQTSEVTYEETDAERLVGMLRRGSTSLKVSGAITSEISKAMGTELRKNEGGLVYLDLSGITGVTRISGYFYFRDCIRLAGIILPKTIEDMDDGAFMDCINLKQITIQEGVKNVTDEAFSRCASLKEVSLPSTVISIGEQAFFECTSLEKINFPGKLKEIGRSAFSGCKNLTEARFPESLINIEQSAFQNCEKLVTVTLPKHLEILEDRAFAGCTGIVDVTISSDIRGMSWSGSPFSDCPNIKKITVAEGVKEVPTYYFATTAETLIFPSTLTVLPDLYDSTVTTVYIHAKNPPKANDNSFPKKTIKNIYVPKASVKAYEDAWFNYEYTFDGQIKPMP